MLLNAEKIFDMNDDFYVEPSDPERVEEFHRKHIMPAGDAVDSEYGYVIGRHQRAAFVEGFRAAVQLLMDCARQSGDNKQ